MEQLQEHSYVREQYKTQDNLQTRVRTHELYGEPQVDFAAWVLDKIPWRGDETVVDVGCGSGMYVDPVRARTPHLVAADLSLGMLRALSRPGLMRVNLNAQQLPFADDVADVVLANHMLYHVPDQDAAVGEMARVLRPGGHLIAATNSRDNMAEFKTLERQASEALGAPEPRDFRPRLSFTLEDGADLLGRHFAHVERHDLPGALVFPEARPVLAYLGSSRQRYERFLPAGVTWEDVAAALNEIVSQHIARHGEFRVHKLTGVFVCRNEA